MARTSIKRTSPVSHQSGSKAGRIRSSLRTRTSSRMTWPRSCAWRTTRRSRSIRGGPIQRSSDPTRAGVRSAPVGGDRVAGTTRRIHDHEHVGASGGCWRSAGPVARARAKAAEAAGLKRAAVLAPGYGGTAEQPILRKLGAALGGFGIASQAVTFRTRGSRPSKDYVSEIEDLRGVRDALRAAGHERVALVGRSFGGRICAFLAERQPPDAR